MPKVFKRYVCYVIRIAEQLLNSYRGELQKIYIKCDQKGVFQSNMYSLQQELNTR